MVLMVDMVMALMESSRKRSVALRFEPHSSAIGHTLHAACANGPANSPTNGPSNPMIRILHCTVQIAIALNSPSWVCSHLGFK